MRGCGLLSRALSMAASVKLNISLLWLQIMLSREGYRAALVRAFLKSNMDLINQCIILVPIPSSTTIEIERFGKKLTF